MVVNGYLKNIGLGFNMNEQVIAKLVKQAGISRSMKECFEKNWNDIDRESPIGWYICTQARFENFIELIVQECAKIADVERPSSLGCGYITKTKGMLIRERFGVKEKTKNE